MKKSFLAIWIATVCAQTVWAQVSQLPASEIQHWAPENLKQVYWLPAYELRLSLSELAADDEYWAQLDVEVRPSAESFAAEQRALKQAYPEREAVRVFAEAEGSFRLSSRLLPINVELQPKLGPDNLPFARHTSYLSKSLYDSLKSLTFKERAELVKVAGTLVAAVPHENVVESLAVGSEICRDLLAGSPSGRALDLLESFPRVSRGIDARGASAELRAKLKRKILGSCLTLRGPDSIVSFQELLDATLELNPYVPAQLVVERKAVGPKNERIPLKASIKGDL